VLHLAAFDKKEEYLELLMNQIRSRKAKSLVVQEIEQHIEDQKASFYQEGCDENTATIKALEQMGDPIAVGKQLDKIHKPRMEWRILILALTLCILGVIAQLSIAKSLGGSNLPLGFDVSRHILFMTVGFFLMLSIYFLDYSILGRFPKVIWVILIAGMLVYIPFGNEVNGQLPYLYAYGMLFIPVYGGILYAYGKKGYVGIVKCLLFSIIVCMLEVQNVAQCAVYLGLLLSSLIMLSVAVMKNWFGGSKRKALAIIWGWIPITCFILLFFNTGMIRAYQIERFKSMFAIIINPRLYAKGYQMNTVRGIISQADLFRGAPDFTIGFLPGFNNDYILTYVIGKWGLAAGILLIVIFLTFISHMIHISLKQKKSLGMFVGLGCSLVYAVQGGIYILSNLSIQFIAQVNLPFVSYGGAGLLINFIVLGLMLSVFRNTNIIKEVPYKEKFILHIERVK
jgi:cell division protein FtsW (lipid II flippase)